MNRSIDIIEAATKWALFLFPIGLVTVEHWSSGFFIVLVLLGLFSLRKNLSLVKLQREEKIVILLFALLFFSFLLSATVNGWEYYHVRHIEDEIRFLLFAPIYLLVRRVDGVMKYLVQGSVLGIFVTFGVALYETSVLGVGRATGAYSPLLLGPVVATMVFVVVNNLRLMDGSIFWRYLSLFALPLGGYAAYLSVSRSAYVLVVALSIITILILVDRKSMRAVWVAVLISAVFLSHQFVPKITQSVDRVADGLSEIMDADSLATVNTGESGSSTKQRIVMWHAAYQIFSDNMLFGIGRGGYVDVIQGYVDSGRINPVAANHGHPHNIYAESLLSNGLVGVVILLLLIIYLYYWAFRCLTNGLYATNGMIIIVSSLFIAGMFEASLMIKGNYISFNLVYLAVAIGAMVHDNSVKEKE